MNKLTQIYGILPHEKLMDINYCGHLNLNQCYHDDRFTLRQNNEVKEENTILW